MGHNAAIMYTLLYVLKIDLISLFHCISGEILPHFDIRPVSERWKMAIFKKIKLLNNCLQFLSEFCGKLKVFGENDVRV